MLSKDFEKTGSNKDRQRSCHPKNCDNHSKLWKNSGTCQREPPNQKNPTRKLGKAVGISKSSIHRILTKNLCNILETKACAKSHDSIESLLRDLKRAWKEIPMETTAKVVDDFPKRLRKLEVAQGGQLAISNIKNAVMHLSIWL